MGKMSAKLLRVLAILLCSSACSTPTGATQYAGKTPADAEPTTVPATVSQSTPTATTLSEPAETAAPIAIVSLEGQILKFECVDRANCIPDTDLAGYVLLDTPFELARVYYWSPSSVFVTLYSTKTIPWSFSVIHINAQTGGIKSTKLPVDFDDIRYTVIGGRFIVAGYGEDFLYILSNDLSIIRVDIGFPIRSLIGANERQVIALNTDPVEQEDDAYVNVSIIDVITGDARKEGFKLPGLEINRSLPTSQAGHKYLFTIEGISRDLTKLYCLYVLGGTPLTGRLGTFDIETSQEVAFTEDRELIHITYGYAQYHDILFTGNPGSGESLSTATLVNMSTVTSLLDFDQNPLWRHRLVIVPFGENFLLGSMSQIILMSQSGEILQRYPLPEKWLSRNYKLMYFTQ